MTPFFSTLQKKPTINICVWFSPTPGVKMLPPDPQVLAPVHCAAVLFPSYPPQAQLDPRMDLPHGWMARVPPGCRVPNQAFSSWYPCSFMRCMLTEPRSPVPQLSLSHLLPAPGETPGFGASQVLGAQRLSLAVTPESSRKCIRASCGVEFLLANAGD